MPHSLKDVPLMAWMILLLLILMGWWTFRYYSGIPPFPEDIKGKILGTEKDESSGILDDKKAFEEREKHRKALTFGESNQTYGDSQ
jgi:hypothetical protein